jgi:hypothetical protein
MAGQQVHTEHARSLKIRHASQPAATIIVIIIITTIYFITRG